MVCMNFLAMPTLKKVRSWVLEPISMMRFFSLNLTLDRERTGISMDGSLPLSAALMTRSARPTSFFSTLPAVLLMVSPEASDLPALAALQRRQGLRLEQELSDPRPGVGLAL